MKHPELGESRLHTGGIMNEAQLRELFEIDLVAYGDASISFPLFRGWWQAFPRGLSVVFEGAKIVAALGIWPLSLATAALWKTGELHESELDPRDMWPFQQRPASSWYVSGIVVGPNAPRRALQTLLDDGWLTWQRAVLIEFPCELLALASSGPGRLVLERSSFRCAREAGLMPNGFPLYRRVFASAGELEHRLRQARPADAATTLIA